jgi:hypothetical protein
MLKEDSTAFLEHKTVSSSLCIACCILKMKKEEPLFTLQQSVHRELQNALAARPSRNPGILSLRCKATARSLSPSAQAVSAWAPGRLSPLLAVSSQSWRGCGTGTGDGAVDPSARAAGAHPRARKRLHHRRVAEGEGDVGYEVEQCWSSPSPPRPLLRRRRPPARPDRQGNILPTSATSSPPPPRFAPMTPSSLDSAAAPRRCRTRARTGLRGGRHGEGASSEAG